MGVADALVDRPALQPVDAERARAGAGERVVGGDGERDAPVGEPVAAGVGQARVRRPERGLAATGSLVAEHDRGIGEHRQRERRPRGPGPRAGPARPSPLAPAARRCTSAAPAQIAASRASTTRPCSVALPGPQRADRAERRGRHAREDRGPSTSAMARSCARVRSTGDEHGQPRERHATAPRENSGTRPSRAGPRRPPLRRAARRGASGSPARRAHSTTPTAARAPVAFQ